MATRWGIISAGRISQDFASAMLSLPRSDHRLVAIAARDKVNAQEFASNYGAEKAYGTYEELIRDADVEVVYIGSIGPQHFPLAKMSLLAGKHVLCEKSLCVNSKQVKELVGIARTQKRFLMEGIWSRCFPIYEKVREELSLGTIGEVKQVIASLSLPLPSMGIHDRIGFLEKGRGSMLDVGCYCVQWATLVYGTEKPLKVITGGHLKDGIDESTSTTLIYSGGRTATLLTHYGVQLPRDAYAIGTKGTLKVPCPFWCPPTLEVLTRDAPHRKIDIPTPVSTRKFNFSGSAGLVYECEEVRRCLQKGLTECPLMTHDDSILMAEISDSIREQVGVKYTEDLL